MRIGMGYDAHKLTPGRKLILGGVEIPHHPGLEGHSDADVAAHAIIDALLGAAGLGDIGRIFPDTDDAYRDISSLALLRQTADKLADSGYRIINIDSVIVAQSPKLAPFIPQMEKNVAAILDIDPSRVNIKATTEENMGFTGAGQGMAAHAVCLIKKDVIF
ncbi:MAG: 2-C-methyl-D-erythritol 2,4-cyclodiphosphate synthase [Clostridiales bacterium]|jgi:2-C-methyl-D-erythritol 2,4-cyclodiphosphate synthase|nr:2-C-methyl-D-erythritol 2,4-cyclodiphosphate synthase [Clostridiales bacterium]